MQYDTKIRLDAEMVAAIDFARRQESDLPPRAEMIRRLLGRALAVNLVQLVEQRRAIARDTGQEEFEKKLDALSPTGRFFGREK